MEPRYIVAIEIGSSKIKGAVATVDADNTLSVIAIEEDKLVNSVRLGCIQNVANVAGSVNAIVSKLQNRISPRKIKAVYVGVGGRSLVAIPREVERTLHDEMEITRQILDDIKLQAEKLPIERDVVAVETGEWIVDNMSSYTDPEGTYGRHIRASLSVIACKSQIMRNISLVINDKLGLKINGYLVRHTAIADLVLTVDERRLGCMLVDFGAETTTVSIYKNGALRYLATIPLGSRNITRDITALNYLEEKAEELKKLASADPSIKAQSRDRIDSINLTDVNNYVQARAGEIVANIAEQSVYAGFRPEDLPGGVIITGGGSKLTGFSGLLAAQTKLKVRRGLPSAVIRIADSRIEPADAVDVIALLLAASKQPSLMCVEVPPAPAAESVREHSAATDSRQGRRVSDPTDDSGDDSTDEIAIPHTGSGLISWFKNKVRDITNPIDTSEFDDDEKE